MTDPATPFEVGQRVYWMVTKNWCIDWYSATDHLVGGGVVVNPGPAIATIWADMGVDPGMVTMANDAIRLDLAEVEAEVKSAKGAFADLVAAEFDRRKEEAARKKERHAQVLAQKPEPNVHRDRALAALERMDLPWWKRMWSR